MNNPTRSKLNPWLWVILWMFVIFLFSTNTFSGSNTSKIIGPLLKWIVPEITNESISLIQLGFRKSAHIIEYAILALLICNALARGSINFSSASLIIRSVFISFVYAVCDEWHQSWTPDRVGSLIDVLVDSVGAFFGSLCFLWLSNNNKKA